MASPQDTVILGRRAGQTTMADWIRLAPISSQARDVYGILKMHMETFIGSGEDPFPAQELIAAIMQCSQSAVSRYVKELVAIGAVETTRRRVPGGGLQYRLHETPPDSYTGPTTLAQFIPRYLAAKAKANDGANAEPTNDATTEPTNAPNVGRPRRADRRTDVAPTDGTNVATANGATVARTNGATPTTNVAADDPHADALGRLLDEAEALGMFEEDPSGRAKLTKRLRSMLADGWREVELYRLVTENLGGAEKKIYVALRHLRDEHERQARVAKRKAEQAPLGPMCNKGGAHAQYRAANCAECRIEAIEAARAVAPVYAENGRLLPRR